MSDDLEDLKRDYRAIEAPVHLATRISASVADSRTQTSFWMPAAVTCTAILALVWMLPFTGQVAPDADTKPTRPSLLSLATLKPEKPTGPPPSLSQLRSLTVPSMPVKPKPTTPPKSETNYQFENKTIENTTLKEKNDAYI